MKILLDCDGILADFATPYLKIIEELTGFQYKVEDLTNSEYLKGLNLECIDKDVRKVLYQKGYCRKIPVYPEAIDAFNKLKEFGEIVIVTCPMITPYWMFERAEWLRENFGITKENLIFAKKKELVQGDIFIDDNVDNVIKWEQNNTGLSLLFDRPWNKCNNSINRVYTWEKVINIVKTKI